MVRAGITEKSIVVDILAASFVDNKSVNYVVSQDSKRRQRIRGLMEYSFDVCNAFGDVWLSNDQQACGLVLYPDKKKTTLSSILWDAKLALAVIGLDRIGKVLGRESMIKAYHPKEHFTYLWFIGVMPEMQNRGLGSLLLKEIIERSAMANRSIYLETSVERNLSWYKKFGFEEYSILTLSYALYLLRKVQRR